MTDKLRLREVVVVEGKYDAAKLAGKLDALILCTNGFSIFTNEEQKQLMRRLGRQRGLVILTDSDAAGFRIRHYIEKIAAGCTIKHAYIPAVAGKESRKARPSKEGTLGVEGLQLPLLLEALRQAGVQPDEAPTHPAITHTDLFELGLSGGAGSAERRRAFLRRVGLPPRLSKTALCRVLGSLYTRKELDDMLNTEKPVLFWDFHGTLTLPDVTWFEAALEAAAEAVPEKTLTRELLETHFSGTCLPWWAIPSRDTRHITGERAWWGFCEGQFAEMLQKCGYSAAEAERIAPRIREKILQPQRYILAPGAQSTLAQLKARGYRSFVLSNNFPELERITTALGLAPYLEGVVVSGLVGYDKPRREIFEAALARAGHPATAWMIGDNPADDIEGARAAGFTTVLVQGTSPAADHCVASLTEIPALLEA